MTINMYTVDEAYVDYLSSFSKVIFHNSKPNQKNSRKYIGIVMTVHSMDYFIPLSSFKKFAENSPLLVWEMNRRFCFPRFVCIILYVS